MPLPQLHKPFIVPLFIPHAGCPHRCVFCNQTPTTGSRAALPSESELYQSIQRFLAYRHNPQRPTEISFYGGNFLGLPTRSIVRLLEVVAPFVDQKKVDGIRFSTRPDTIDDQRLRVIAPYPITSVELGVQSMNDDVLESSRRGHTARTVRSAMARLRQTNYAVGLQMMIGLPEDTPEHAVNSGTQLTALKPDFVRIYPTLVIAGSPLARWYRQGRYQPWPLETATQVAGRLCILFRQNRIAIARLGLQPTEDLNMDGAVVAGPFHPAFGELVYSHLWFQCISRVMRQNGNASGAVVLRVHPRCISQVKGNQNRTVNMLKSQFQLRDICVEGDPQLPMDIVSINGTHHRWY